MASQRSEFGEPGLEADFQRWRDHADAVALERVLQRLADPAERRAKRLLGNAADSEVAVREALLRLVRHPERSPEGIPVRAQCAHHIHAVAAHILRTHGDITASLAALQADALAEPDHLAAGDPNTTPSTRLSGIVAAVLARVRDRSGTDRHDQIAPRGAGASWRAASAAAVIVAAALLTAAWAPRATTPAVVRVAGPPPTAWSLEPRSALDDLVVDTRTGPMPAGSEHHPLWIDLETWTEHGPTASTNALRALDFGNPPPAGAPWVPGGTTLLDLGKGYAYVQTCVYSPRPCRVRFAVGSSTCAMTWWLDERIVHRARTASDTTVDLELRTGWNRLIGMLARLEQPRARDRGGEFSARLLAPRLAYAATNVRWSTRLPGSDGGPVVVSGGLAYALCAPSDLACIDLESGHLRWIHATTWLDALTEAERGALTQTVAEALPLAEPLADAHLAETLAGDDEGSGLAVAQRTQAEARIDALFGRADARFLAARGRPTLQLTRDGELVARFADGIEARFDRDGRRLAVARREHALDAPTLRASVDGIEALVVGSRLMVTADGRLLLERALGGAAPTASAIAAHGCVYVQGSDGETAVFSSARDHHLLGTNRIGHASSVASRLTIPQERFDDAPVPAGGCLLLRGSERLYCIGGPR